MKKLFYILLFAVTSSMAITGCTEEEVKPRSGHGSSGTLDPVKD